MHRIVATCLSLKFGWKSGHPLLCAFSSVAQCGKTCQYIVNYMAKCAVAYMAMTEQKLRNFVTFPRYFVTQVPVSLWTVKCVEEVTLSQFVLQNHNNMTYILGDHTDNKDNISKTLMFLEQLDAALVHSFHTYIYYFHNIVLNIHFELSLRVKCKKERYLNGLRNHPCLSTLKCSVIKAVLYTNRNKLSELSTNGIFHECLHIMQAVRNLYPLDTYHK